MGSILIDAISIFSIELVNDKNVSGVKIIL
jgi:hypothetical protein